MAALVAASLAGCPPAGTDAGAPDSGEPPPPDLSCIGMPPPATAPDPLLIEATVLEGQTVTGLAGAAFEVRSRIDGTLLGVDTANAGGMVSVDVPSGGVPLPAYAVASAAGYTTLHLYPFLPFVGDEPALPMILYTPAQHEGAQMSLYGVTWDPALGYVRLTLADCAGAPIAGAAVTLTPPAGTLLYDPEPGSPLDPARTTTSSAGTAGAFNVPPGLVEISAEWEGTPLGTQSVAVEAGVAAAVGIVPL